MKRERVLNKKMGETLPVISKKKKEVKLLRCPFCGSEAYVGVETMSEYWSIGCKSCSCNFERRFKSKTEAITFWNKRPEYVAEGMAFVLSKEDVKKLNKWRDKMYNKRKGETTAIGGRWVYQFIPTGLGTMAKVIDYETKTELDLTDYDSF